MMKMYVKELLEKMNDKDKSIVIMTARGYIQDDIGKAIGISKKGVSIRLKRLKNKLIKEGYKYGEQK